MSFYGQWNGSSAGEWYGAVVAAAPTQPAAGGGLYFRRPVRLPITPEIILPRQREPRTFEAYARETLQFYDATRAFFLHASPELASLDTPQVVEPRIVRALLDSPVAGHFADATKCCFIPEELAAKEAQDEKDLRELSDFILLRDD